MKDSGEGLPLVKVETSLAQPGEALVSEPVAIRASRTPIAEIRMAETNAPAALQPKSASEGGSLTQRLQYEKGLRTSKNVTPEERIRMLERQLSENIQTYGGQQRPSERPAIAAGEIAARQALHTEGLAQRTEASLQARDASMAERQKIEADLIAQWEAQKAHLPDYLRRVADEAEARATDNTPSPELKKENLTLEVVLEDGTRLTFKGVGKNIDRDIPIFFNENVPASALMAIGTGSKGSDGMRFFEVVKSEPKNPDDKRAKFDGRATLREIRDLKEFGRLQPARRTYSTEPSAGTLNVPLPSDVRERLGINEETRQDVERRLQTAGALGRVKMK